MEAIQSHKKFRSIVEKHGYQGLLMFLNNRFPDLQIYTVSSDWEWSHCYPLHAYGANGDLTVEWREAQ